MNIRTEAILEDGLEEEEDRSGWLALQTKPIVEFGYIVVSEEQILNYSLKSGDLLRGIIGPMKHNFTYYDFASLEAVNGQPVNTSVPGLQLNKSEAVNLLSACSLLAQKLVSLDITTERSYLNADDSFNFDIDIELTEQEQKDLEGFNFVLLSDWINNAEVIDEAGLTTFDVRNLRFLLNRIQIEKMQKQYLPEIIVR